MSDVTANIGTGSALSASLSTGSLTANLKESGSVFGNEYADVYNSLTTKPSSAIALTQNTMVVTLVNAGIWSKLDVFYLFAQTVNSGGEALKNWINPGTYDATAYNSPTFTALEGFTSDGSTSYIGLNWNPASNGINFIQDSASFGAYVGTNKAAAEAEMGINTGGGDMYLISRGAGGSMVGRVNDGASDTDAVTDSLGFLAVIRSGANTKYNYKNKTQYSHSRASVGVPNGEIYALAWNDSGPSLFNTRQMSMVFAGGALTQTDINNFTDAFETYMDSNSKGVIS